MKLHIDEDEEKELVIVSYCKFLLGYACRSWLPKKL